MLRFPFSVPFSGRDGRPSGVPLSLKGITGLQVKVYLLRTDSLPYSLRATPCTMSSTPYTHLHSLTPLYTPGGSAPSHRFAMLHPPIDGGSFRGSLSSFFLHPTLTPTFHSVFFTPYTQGNLRFPSHRFAMLTPAFKGLRPGPCGPREVGREN